MPKPYKQKMSKTWWLDHPAYRLFMLRELSGVFIAVYSNQRTTCSNRCNPLVGGLLFTIPFYAWGIGSAILRSSVWGSSLDVFVPFNRSFTAHL